MAFSILGGLMQNNLFNLPNFKTSKAKEKTIVDKTSKKPKETVQRVGSSRNKVAEVIQRAKQLMVPDERYELVTDFDRLEQYIEKIVSNGICSLDTETTGLNTMTDDVVGVCLYTPGETAVYVPLRHTDMAGKPLPGQLSVEQVSTLLSRLDSVKVIFHNAKFDIRFLRNSIGVRLSAFWDTSLAGNYLNENEPHRLKYLWSRYVSKDKGDEASNFSDLFDDVPFSLIPMDLGYIYAAGDALKTYELYEFQYPYLNPDSEDCAKKGLKEAALFLRDVDIPLIGVLSDMEDYGVLLNMELAGKLETEYRDRLSDIETRCHDYIKNLDLKKLPLEKSAKLSNPVNISSPTQLAILIYDVMGLNNDTRGTGEDVLLKFSKLSEHGAFFDLILKYREVAKLLSTYVEKLPKVVNPNTGRIHASFNQYGAKTGRFSSSDPNLQNIPTGDKNIRRMFTATPGMVFISCDYSQQEPRVLAHVSQDEKLIQAYKDNKDLYTWIASEVYSVPYEECKEFKPDGTKNPQGKKRRDSMKSVVLGLMYGRGYSAIAEQLQIEKAEAKRIFDMFFKTFPKVSNYIESVKHFAKKNGFVQTVWGRKRRLPEIQLPEYAFDEGTDRMVADMYLAQLKSAQFKQKENVKSQARAAGVNIIDNGGKIADAERQSVNSIIQGTSADITKSAMLLIGSDETIKKLGGQMILTVHDEIILEGPEQNKEDLQERMVSLMIEAAAHKVTVPMKVDSEITYCWYGDPIG